METPLPQATSPPPKQHLQTNRSTAPSPPPPAPARRRTSRAHCLLAPRPYEEIYHEQAYLATHLQQKTQRIEGLIREYSAAQAQLGRGAEGKTRRRLRKLQNLLRCKLDEASEQERAIFCRMGELYLEQTSRDTWERARIAAQQNPEPDVVVVMAEDVGEPDDDEGSGRGAAAPVTPCPSFTSSDCSAASSVRLPVPPVYTAEPTPSYAAAPPLTRPPPPRCLTSDYLETVPEESDNAARLQSPTTPRRPPPVQEDESLLPPPYQECSGEEPEMGTLDYYYVQDDTPPSQDDEEAGSGAHDCAEATGRESCKLRPNRFSLPAMQFTWPEA